MTFDQVWGQLTRKQPKLKRSESVVEFTAGNLRRLLRQVYEQGAKSVETKSEVVNPPGDPRSVGDLFGGIFGGGQ